MKSILCSLSGMNKGSTGSATAFGTKIGKTIRLVRLIRLLRIMKALTKSNKKTAKNASKGNKVHPLSKKQSLGLSAPSDLNLKKGILASLREED